MREEHRTTRYNDVCGSVDELKRLLVEEPQTVADDPEPAVALVEDILFMQARMEARLREYEAFRAQVAELAAALRGVAGSRRQETLEQAPALLALLRAGRPPVGPELAAALARAEAIRAVAVDLERALYRYKALAIELARVGRAIRRDRSWALDETEARVLAEQPGEPSWARWLPPSPHRERILRYLRAGRAHLLDADGAAADSPAEPPVVQFEDGGAMPLPEVRWSEEVRAFHPVGALPHPRGPLYRPG